MSSHTMDAHVNASLAALEAAVTTTHENMDQFFLLVMGFIIYREYTVSNSWRRKFPF